MNACPRFENFLSFVQVEYLELYKFDWWGEKSIFRNAGSILRFKSIRTGHLCDYLWVMNQEELDMLPSKQAKY